MKIGIITFHFASNCGAVLQCLALSEILTRLGHDAMVIDYRPKYHINRYQAMKNPFFYARAVAQADRRSGKRSKIFKYIKGFVGAIYSWRWYPNKRTINKRFESFSRENLKLTKRYLALSDLQTDPPFCDLYIAGSDQIWNTKLTGGTFDQAYLLDFGDDKTQRISYAAGVSAEDIYATIKENKKLFDRFKTISLRENQYYDCFKDLLDVSVSLRRDLDPTLLLERNEYEKYISLEVLETEHYILTYTMQDPSQDEVYKAATLLAQQTGFKIIDISNNPKYIKSGFMNSRICGPSEFLWYIEHAEFVITNSYHSTIFSIIFEKNFAVVPHLQTGYRIRELLALLDLSQHQTSNVEAAVERYHKKTEYVISKQKIKHYKQHSIEYLKMLISNRQKEE